jgi:hypothetical protein
VKGLSLVSSLTCSHCSLRLKMVLFSRISMILRAFLLLIAASTIASANSIILSSTYSVIGLPSQFEMFTLSLTQPTGGDPNWELSIQTNYGTTLPGSPDIPAWNYDGNTFGMSDFLFTWNGGYYGVVLSPHDGYTAGDLYQATGFQTSGDVLGDASPSTRAAVPVLLIGGGNLIGTGIVGASVTGNGNQTGMYTVTDSFSATAGLFDSGEIDITESSWVCANGLITGSGDFSGSPEPGTILQSIPALLLSGFGVARRQGRKSRERGSPVRDL